MVRKLTTEEFIEKAKTIHGDKYDYSDTIYINAKTKVAIKCKKCKKIFLQIPSKHLLGQGCPKLCYINKNRILFDDFVKKMQILHNNKYVYDEDSFNVRLSNNYKIKIFCKNCNKYFYQDLGHHVSGEGCPHCMHTRAKETLKHKYGNEHYNNREKMKNTCLKRYGKYYVQTQEFKDKARLTCLKKYGKEFSTQVQEKIKKGYETRKKNGTLATSKPEQIIKTYLSLKFINVEYQYRSKEYPFACDFYIPSKNLYIEYQGYEGHGKEPYDPSNPKHQELLNKWQQKAKEKEKLSNKKSKYSRYIEVWTVRDPLKRKTAKNNGLNWLEFFTIEEFIKWYDKN